MGYFSMPKYFQNMPTVGKELVNVNDENAKRSKPLRLTSMIHRESSCSWYHNRREVKRARPVIRNAAYQRSH